MEKKGPKSPWRKPELKILVKGRAEEAVLGSCKNYGTIFEGGPFGIKCGTLLGILCNQDTAS